jgi:hypothetical protein
LGSNCSVKPPTNKQSTLLWPNTKIMLHSGHLIPISVCELPKKACGIGNEGNGFGTKLLVEIMKASTIVIDFCRYSCFVVLVGNPCTSFCTFPLHTHGRKRSNGAPSSSPHTTHNNHNGRNVAFEGPRVPGAFESRCGRYFWSICNFTEETVPITQTSMFL